MNRLTRVHRLARVLLLTAALVGCSNGGATRSTTLGTAASVPACADVASVGKPVLKETIEFGCRLPDGSVNLFVTIMCKDGRTFTTYNDELRGFVGDVWKAGASGSDPAYANDSNVCTGS